LLKSKEPILSQTEYSSVVVARTQPAAAVAEPPFPLRPIEIQATTEDSIAIRLLAVDGNDLGDISLIVVQIAPNAEFTEFSDALRLIQGVNFEADQTYTGAVITGLSDDTNYYLRAFCEV
jgi:hypothetical protein